jgi:hypothetical protein
MYDFEISCSGIMNHYHDSSTNLIILIFIVNILNYEGNLLIRGYYIHFGSNARKGFCNRMARRHRLIIGAP